MTDSAAGPGGPPRRRFFFVAVILLLLWAAGLVAIAVTVIPDAYWYSYFSVDYTLGFVRRGLAGELLGVFGDDYFGALRILRWLPTVFFAGGLAVVGWAVARGPVRSDRRVLMALLIPVLPFGFAFGLFSARTDLFAAAALAVYAVALTRAGGRRSVTLVSAGYGLISAGLTLIHEATPFLYGLGAVAALAVLVRPPGDGAFRLAAVLAVGPGVATAVAVATLGRRGASAQLCRLVPHGPINHPLAGKPTLGQLLRGFRYEIDYHDWMCRSILPLFDQSFGDAVRFVGGIGVGALAASTVYGIGAVAAALLAIAHVSGVPISRFRAMLRQQEPALVVGIALLVPVFLTGADWIRWFVIAGFDVGIVFLLYAAGQPEPDRPPTRRTLRIYTAGAVLLALLPIGIVPGFGAPVPM